MKLTRKEKDLLALLLNKQSALASLDYSYQEGDEETFREDYGVSFKTALRVYKKLIVELSK